MEYLRTKEPAAFEEANHIIQASEGVVNPQHLRKSLRYFADLETALEKTPETVLRVQNALQIIR